MASEGPGSKGRPKPLPRERTLLEKTVGPQPPTPQEFREWKKGRRSDGKRS